jgi:hypothetical protein
MWSQGLTFAEIGRQMGISKQRAYQLVICAGRPRIKRQRLNFRPSRLHAILVLGGRCVVCGTDDLDVLELDHITPLYQTNKNREPTSTLAKTIILGQIPPRTIQVLCANCHSRKTRSESSQPLLTREEVMRDLESAKLAQDYYARIRGLRWAMGKEVPSYSPPLPVKPRRRPGPPARPRTASPKPRGSRPATAEST